MPTTTTSREVDATLALAQLRDLMALGALGDRVAAADAAALFGALDTYLTAGGMALPADWARARTWTPAPEAVPTGAGSGPVEQSVASLDGQLLLGLDDIAAPVVRIIEPDTPPRAHLMPPPANHAPVPTGTPTSHPLGDHTPLVDVQDWVTARLDHGTTCPACGQQAKKYARTIYATLARNLIALWTVGGPERRFLSLSRDLKQGGGDTSKLRHWGLIEEHATLDPAHGRAGYWRLTELGVDFVLGHATVPSHALFYDGTCHGFQGDQISIHDALGARFDYDTLMGALRAA